jgi:hypothetical protein
MQIMLLSIILEKFPYKQERSEMHRQLERAERAFTVEEVKGYLDIWADQVKPYWEWTGAELDRLLRALTMTLAISVEDDGISYYFPQEILPTVLFKLQLNLIEELDGYVKRYIRLCGGN